MVNTTGTLFEGYRRGGTGAGAWDEMFDVQGRPRPEYRAILQALDQMTGAEFRDRTASLASSYLAQGITFDFAGEEKPFPLDAVPRVISPQDWHYLESGVAQRVRALEMFLADIYGPGRCVKDGVIPAKLISSSAHFHRQAHGIESANGVRVMVAGIDVIRDEKGLWRVLEDNVRVPSGVSYVISNRRVMGQTLPELFFQMSVRAVGDYPHKLLAALRASAPNGIDDPTVVVLTPGVYNSAYYEHSLLARLMGVELVEGRDLFCTGGRVMMHTTSGPRRVDVIYRRIDDEFLDPLQFRPDSVLGAPGLIEAARRGNVTLANAIGNGVADDKLVYTYMPALMDYYLGEKPILPNVDTWRLEDPGALEEVFDRLDELCVKPVDGSGGKGLVMGPTATAAELDALRARLRDDPRGWIAQPVVQLSTIPTLVEDGIRPRHADLRPFAVNDGEDVWVLPGGLTRVALPEGKLVVNSSQGGGSKDTWVLSRTADHQHDEALEPAVERIDVDAQEDAAEREAERLEAERLEAERLESERLEAERLEAPSAVEDDDTRSVEPLPSSAPSVSSAPEPEPRQQREASQSSAQDPTPADVRAEPPAEPAGPDVPPLQPEERPIVIHPPETSRLDQAEESNQQQQQQQQQARGEVPGC